MASQVGSNSLLPHIQALSALPKGSKLEHIVCLDTVRFPGQGSMCQTYSTFLNGGHSIFMNDSALRRAERKVRRTDTLNLQFTSGEIPPPIFTCMFCAEGNRSRDNWITQSRSFDPFVRAHFQEALISHR